jgi:hypothetical protein
VFLIAIRETQLSNQKKKLYDERPVLKRAETRIGRVQIKIHTDGIS